MADEASLPPPPRFLTDIPGRNPRFKFHQSVKDATSSARTQFKWHSQIKYADIWEWGDTGGWMKIMTIYR